MREDKDKMETEEQSTLFTAPKSITDSVKNKKAKSFKKQWIAIAVSAAGVAAAICVYFFGVAPYIERLQEEAAKKNETAPIELLEGEVLATGNKVLLYKHFERKDIGEITVHNEHGDFGFYYKTEDESFYVKDHETAPFDANMFASLIVSVGKTTAERIMDECEDLEQYGLSPEQDPAWFEMTTRDGAETHRVYVGVKAHDGTGYYAKYEGREALYIIDDSVETTVLAPIENMLTPLLTLPMAQNDYFTINNFAVLNGQDPVIVIDYLTPEQKEAEAATNAYKMLYPAKYEVHSTNYSEVMYSLVEFKGLSTLVYTPTDEDLEEYGLAEPKYSIHYTYKELEQFVVISEKNENGNYYAYSAIFDLITEIDGDTYKWVEWDLINWVDEPIFMMNINDVGTITIKSDTATRVYDIEGTGQEIIVTERETSFKPDVANFKNFYKSLLSIYLQGYVSVDLTEDKTEALKGEDAYLTITVETRQGKVTEYKFYPYHTRRAYYTVNGSGEFYILRDMATKIISDSEKVMTNTTVDSTAHS